MRIFGINRVYGEEGRYRIELEVAPGVSEACTLIVSPGPLVQTVCGDAKFEKLVRSPAMRVDIYNLVFKFHSLEIKAP